MRRHFLLFIAVICAAGGVIYLITHSSAIADNPFGDDPVEPQDTTVAPIPFDERVRDVTPVLAPGNAGVTDPFGTSIQSSPSMRLPPFPSLSDPGVYPGANLTVADPFDSDSNLAAKQSQLRTLAQDYRAQSAAGRKPSSDLESEIDELNESVWQLEQELLQREVDRLKARLQDIETKLQAREKQRQGMLQRRKRELTEKSPEAPVSNTLSGGRNPTIKPPQAPVNTASQIDESRRRMKKLMVALHQHYDEHKHFPPAVSTMKDGKPCQPYSWRVAILPALGDEGKALYEQYRFNEPWDSAKNSSLIGKMPDVYQSPFAEEGSTNASYFALTCPRIRGQAEIGIESGYGGPAVGEAGSEGASSAAEFDGADPALGPVSTRKVETYYTIFSSPVGTPFHVVYDGTSNTVALVEAQRDIPWTKPEDINYDPEGELPEMGDGVSGGVVAGFVDGSAKFLKDLPEQTWRYLIEMNDGHPVDLSGHVHDSANFPVGTPSPISTIKPEKMTSSLVQAPPENLTPNPTVTRTSAIQRELLELELHSAQQNEIAALSALELAQSQVTKGVRPQTDLLLAESAASQAKIDVKRAELKLAQFVAGEAVEPIVQTDSPAVSKVDRELLQLEVHSRESALRLAQQQYERIRKLAETGAISQSELLEATVKLENAQVDLERYKLLLEKHDLQNAAGLPETDDAEEAAPQDSNLPDKANGGADLSHPAVGPPKIADEVQTVKSVAADQVTVDIYAGADLLPGLNRRKLNESAKKHQQLISQLNAIADVVTNIRVAGPGEEIQMAIVSDPSGFLDKPYDGTGEQPSTRNAISRALEAAGVTQVRWSAGHAEETPDVDMQVETNAEEKEKVSVNAAPQLAE